MSRRAYVRASMAMAAAEFFPRMVRDELISDANFRREFDLSADATINIGQGDIAFQRSILFAAVKTVFDADSDKETTHIPDQSGVEWGVQILRDNKPVTVALIQGQQRLLIRYLALLAPSKDTRLEAFRHQAEEANLPADSKSSWECLLSERVPSDDELTLIMEDIGDTPTFVAETIRDCLESGTVSLDIIIPRSIQYYERLVGKYERGTKFENYVTGPAAELMRANIVWRSFDGLQLNLLLACQPKLSAELSKIMDSSTQLAPLMEWAANQGDPVSRTACIEIGLPRLSAEPSLKGPIVKLCSALSSEYSAAKVDQFDLLSSLIFAVYGELSNRRSFASHPPYWRRLAAIAHASLILRQIIINGNDASGLVAWFSGVRSQIYLLRCFADMREEPRWIPEFGMQQQLRNELIGRAWISAKGNEAIVIGSGLEDRLLAENVNSLVSQFSLPHACFPGPLEAGSVAPGNLPTEFAEAIKSSLSSAAITASSFNGFLNIALICSIPEELVDLAILAIEKAGYYLPLADPEASAEGQLYGLAFIAASGRHARLADTIFTVLRVYRRLYADELSVEDAFRIGVIASASRIELLEWARCVGRYVSDLAFSEISREDASRLHSNIVHLCNLIPELWGTCGQAEAALRAVLQI